MGDRGRRGLTLLRDAFNDPPWLDMAMSRVLLDAAETDPAAETLRIYRPASVVAFGPADRLRPGYRRAREAALAAGFTPVDRLAGGHAAVFHADTVALCWTVSDGRARAGIHDRFRTVSALVSRALCRIGLDARVGAVGGEYCPGTFSINAGGRAKVAGFGQRVLNQAAHVGGVIVADGAERVVNALGPVYDALGLEWTPETASSLRAEGVDADWEEVATAIIDEFRACFDVVSGSTSPTLVERARSLASCFEAPWETPASFEVGR